MMPAISRRVLTASVPLVSLLIALGVTPRAAQAVDEFATPRPRITAKPTVGTRVSEIYVLRAPDLVGQPVASARAMLERGRLHAGRETSQLTNEHPAGTVIAQDPKPGTALQPGASVNLWIATPPRVAAMPAPAPQRLPPGTRVPSTDGGRAPGASDRSDYPTLPPQRQDVIVPNLIGQTAETASAVLAKPGLSLGDRRRQDSEAPVGTVIAQTPVAGTRVHPGTSIDVTIAVPALVAVPDLTGETPLQAARLLRRSQLALGQERQRESQAPAGTVIRQSPAAGTRVPRETLVNVLIATAPAPAPLPTSSTTPVPPRPPIVIAPPIVVAPPVVIKPPVVIAPPVIVAPPVVIAPPAPPAPPVATASELPPAPPVAPAPQLPPAPPVVTAPPTPAAPIVTPPPAVAAAPPAPAPIRKPAPKPLPPTPPAAPAPQPPAPPIAAPAPAPQPEAQPVRESGKARWPSPLAWGLGSMVLLGAGGTVYYRVRTTTTGAQPVPTVPTVTFAAHWDVGTQQIEAIAPLSSGTGLHLLSGVETAITTLETDHLVGTAHDTGGSR
jgi:beta-lactam-binding protein with PASTA domain